MVTPESPSLAVEFPSAREADWRKLVDGVLKGASFEKLISKTYDGLKIEPIYPRARNAVLVGGRTAAAPWQIMQRIDHPDPAVANEQALRNLENGATGLTVVCKGSVNANGYGLDSSRETLDDPRPRDRYSDDPRPGEPHDRQEIG